MRLLPSSVREHISNAEYYLEAADKHLAPTRNAVHILLLIIGWENVDIADAQLRAWAKKESVDEKLYKSHAYKLRKTPEVRRNILGQRGTKLETVRFSSGEDLEKLRMDCMFGSKTETEEVKELFKSGWHFDRLRNGLREKIVWLRMLANIFEELEKTKVTKLTS